MVSSRAPATLLALGYGSCDLPSPDSAKAAITDAAALLLVIYEVHMLVGGLCGRAVPLSE